MDSDKKFKKYSIIEAEVENAPDDKRPESYRIYINSIKILNHFDTSDRWERRKKFVLSKIDKSMCEIFKNCECRNQSLGIFKPRGVDFIIKKSRPEDESGRKECYAQLSLFNKNKNAIEKIPFEFRYNFFCFDEPECPGHNFPIIDWEIGQAYRYWRSRYGSEKVLLDKIKEKWLRQMCSEKKDTYFYVGNMQRFKNNFMILGVFYPPKI